MSCTAEDYKEWLQIPETKDFLSQLDVLRNGYLDDLLNVNAQGDELTRRYFSLQGKANGLQLAIERAYLLAE